MFLQKTAPKNAENVVISTKINISLREKEKTVSLVPLPTQPQLIPKRLWLFADIIDIMSL